MFAILTLDLSECSSFPERVEYEAAEGGQDADMLRASKIIGIDFADLQAIAASTE
jgi:hypothetical protein